MMPNSLYGVIPAVPTPVDETGKPDCDRLVALIRDLLGSGCHGVNLLGTTGEATSFNLATRLHIMETVAAHDDLRPRLMVGTGAASASDAIVLTSAAEQLKFRGALLLPPFYYIGITDRALVDYVERIANAAALVHTGLYLYNYPQLTGITFGTAVVGELRTRLGPQLVGVKDSSGDLDYARALASQQPGLSVFPSSESTLCGERSGLFAGCISATVNVMPDWAVDAYRSGLQERRSAHYEAMVALRSNLTAVPLVAAVKHALGLKRNDLFWQTMVPPLSPLGSAHATQVAQALVAT